MERSILTHEQFLGDFSTTPLIGNLQPWLIGASFHYPAQYLNLIKEYAESGFRFQVLVRGYAYGASVIAC